MFCVIRAESGRLLAGGKANECLSRFASVRLARRGPSPLLDVSARWRVSARIRRLPPPSAAWRRLAGGREGRIGGGQAVALASAEWGLESPLPADRNVGKPKRREKPLNAA
jgi:hypothetical protein